MNFLKNNSGQTSVEYILIILVVTIFGLGVMGKVKDYVVGRCPGEALVCRLTAVFQSPAYFSRQNNFKTFVLRR